MKQILDNIYNILNLFLLFMISTAKDLKLINLDSKNILLGILDQQRIRVNISNKLLLKP